MARLRSLCGCLLVLVAAVSARSQELTVAAAADLQFAMQDLAGRFQTEAGTSVKVTYGSSGNFVQQIENGAPFDMFFSANLDYARELEISGFAEPGTLYKYARGKIVIWTPNVSKLDLSSGLKLLLDPSIRKIAIANPEHAPYGKAAVAALEHERIYDKVRDKLVLGENISQAMTFVVSGSADVSIVALSLALSPEMKDQGRYVEVPADDYPAIEQACMVVRQARNKDAAVNFLAFMKTAKARDVLRTYGFDVP